MTGSSESTSSGVHRRERFKLVDQAGFTRKGETGETFWEVGATVKPVGAAVYDPPKPCAPGILHYYSTREVASFLNPAHAAITAPRLLVVEVEEENGPLTDGAKCWTARPVRVLREEPFVVPSREQCVRFAILVTRALKRTQPKIWEYWADGLNGKDRSDAYAADAAAYAAAHAADASTFLPKLEKAALAAFAEEK